MTSRKYYSEQNLSTEEAGSAASKFPRALAGSRFCARGGLALMGAMAALLLAGCASSPAKAPTSPEPTVPEPGTAESTQQDTWPDPIVFAWRTANHQGPPALGAGDTQGRPVAFKSAATPAVAAALSREMARSGVNVVPVGTPNAVEVDVQLQAWLMPPGGLGRTRADVELAQTIEQVLVGAGGKEAAGATLEPGQNIDVFLPLSGWKAPIGQTGISAGMAGFLFLNLGEVTGLRRRFNSLFGADATGTICLFPAKSCARSKGPQQDFVLTGTYSLGGQERTITSALLLVQPKPNILQPLAYAIADWRSAALGQNTPNCQFWKTGERTADCEPVPSPLGLKDLR